MIWIALTLSPFIIFGVGHIFSKLTTRLYRSHCPACDGRGLKMVGFVHSSVFDLPVEEHHFARKSASFHVCDHCDTKSKYHRGEWSDVSDE